MFKMEFETGGAAFRDPHTGDEDEWYESEEIIRIIKKVERAVALGNTHGTIIDMNGNKVGSWSR